MMTDLVPLEVVADKEDKKDSDDIVVFQKSQLATTKLSGIVLHVRKKSIVLAGKKYELDPKAVMRMIKQVTRTIGEYKENENPLAAYVVPGLRKARDSMSADLSYHFGIDWQLDRDGNSIFSM